VANGQSVSSNSWIVVESSLVRAMIEEMRKKIEPLEHCGLPLNDLVITVRRTGKQVTSDVHIGGGGYTLIPPPAPDKE
jgi:hypothetical protein